MYEWVGFMPLSGGVCVASVFDCRNKISGVKYAAQKKKKKKSEFYTSHINFVGI